MRKVAGKTRASLEEIRKLKGQSHLGKLIDDQKKERAKPEEDK